MNVVVPGVAIFFVAMGLVALAAPERISATFGNDTLTTEGRSEVRTVHGGFGVAIGALLLTAADRPGVALCVAVALVVARP